MKTNHKPRRRGGYVTYTMVLATAALLTFLTLYGYRRAVFSQSVQTDVQLRADYGEKEDAVLRSIVAIVPNRAMRAMQNSSSVSGPNRDSLRWQNIFADALTQANASTSVTAEMKAAIGKTSAITANTGDGSVATTNLIFTNIHGGANTVYVTPGINRSASAGYPESLVTADSTVSANDAIYPIIATSKNYAGLAAREYKTLKYPAINFGYAKPGENFLAKRNWWAFSMDLAAHNATLTSAPLNRRQFVLSIYEIPSQLAISASSFVELGTYENGSDWKHIDISGNVFADRAVLKGGRTLTGLASRRGMTLNSGTNVAGVTGNPFTPGVREEYEMANSGGFFPVSMPSESGRAAFIPINRENDFFDRFSDTNATESNTLSTTTWNDYSSGANQCAMRLDVTKVTSATNLAPTEFKFQYFKNSVRTTLTMPPIQGNSTTLPPGYIQIRNQDQSYPFQEPVDVAYGVAGGFYFKTGVSGTVKFDNDTFGNPRPGYAKYGYYRPRAPFTTTSGPGGKICIALYPERFPAFLEALDADDVKKNHSIVVNSDYKSSTTVRKPSFPSQSQDYGLIINECANLSAFTKGFSLVTNYRLYIGSDFNTTSILPPAGYTGPLPYYPPCSLFAPEKRYGSDMNPFSVGHLGQVGSLARNRADEAVDPTKAIHPLESVGMDGTSLNGGNTTINLRPITDPADLPPVTMMNWLVLIEERRKEYW